MVGGRVGGAVPAKSEKTINYRGVWFGHWREGEVSLQGEAIGDGETER